jgi:nucleotide-binding universal stress UspA family protein
MSYKTIFTVMTEFDANSPVLTQAVALAASQDAHLEVMCLGLDRSHTNYYEVGASAVILQNSIEETNAKADAILGETSEFLRGTNLRWNALSTIATIGDVTRSVAAIARFSDLAIVALPYAETARSDESVVLEAMLFDAACPTLVVPKGQHAAPAETVVIGWNESAEALRAVRSALPFLKQAKTVHIAIIDPPEYGPNRSDPGGALAVFLSRHGIGCDIQVMTRAGARVSERLQRHVTETGADLLVMGGYGHSRFREAVLGGATREMLEHSKVPVLMAH